MNIYIQLLQLPYKLLYIWPKRVLLIIMRVIRMANIAWRSKERTLYQNETRINRLKIFYLLLIWYIRYGSVNSRFYDYGLDRKYIRNYDQYIDTKKFESLRDEKNLYSNSLDNTEYNYMCLVRDKFIFSKYLSSFSIPVIKNLAIFNQKTVWWLDSKIKYETRHFFTYNETEIDGFCKPIDSGKGQGIFSLKLKCGKIYLDNREVTFEQFLKKLSGNYIVQERLVQHPVLDKIYPDSVNTMRIVTFNNNGKPEPFLGVIRFGSGGKNIDNISKGGIAVGVDLKTGKLFSYGFHNKNDKPEFIEKHPDTGCKFNDFKVPGIKEAIQLISQAHKWLYGIYSIGWDVALTSNGPVILEANDGWGCMTFMVTHKRFKDELSKYWEIEE